MFTIRLKELERPDLRDHLVHVFATAQGTFRPARDNGRHLDAAVEALAELAKKEVDAGAAGPATLRVGGIEGTAVWVELEQAGKATQRANVPPPPPLPPEAEAEEPPAETVDEHDEDLVDDEHADDHAADAPQHEDLVEAPPSKKTKKKHA